MNNSILVQEFIDQIWNKKAFDKMHLFLHADFTDYSLPPALPSGKEGTIKWIINTGLSFDNKTIIEEQVTEGNKSIVKIKMDLTHVGVWRNIEPTGKNLHVTGYRYFTIEEEKIIGHWALIDGQAIENQLREAHHGCVIAK